jgi:hypothetical protein
MMRELDEMIKELDDPLPTPPQSIILHSIYHELEAKGHPVEWVASNPLHHSTPEKVVVRIDEEHRTVITIHEDVLSVFNTRLVGDYRINLNEPDSIEQLEQRIAEFKDTYISQIARTIYIASCSS